MKKISISAECNRCVPSWTCQELSDGRTILTTDIASTFAAVSIVECRKRIKEMLDETVLPYQPIHNGTSDKKTYH